VELRKQAGAWLQERRKAAGLSQIELAQRLGLKYYTFHSRRSKTASGASRATAWQPGRAPRVAPAEFARHLLVFYEPELHNCCSRSSHERRRNFRATIPRQATGAPTNCNS